MCYRRRHRHDWRFHKADSSTRRLLPLTLPNAPTSFPCPFYIALPLLYIPTTYLFHLLRHAHGSTYAFRHFSRRCCRSLPRLTLPAAGPKTTALAALPSPTTTTAHAYFVNPLPQHRRNTWAPPPMPLCRRISLDVFNGLHTAFGCRISRLAGLWTNSRSTPGATPYHRPPPPPYRAHHHLLMHTRRRRDAHALGALPSGTSVGRTFVPSPPRCWFRDTRRTVPPVSASILLVQARLDAAPSCLPHYWPFGASHIRGFPRGTPNQQRATREQRSAHTRHASAPCPRAFGSLTHSTTTRHDDTARRLPPGPATPACALHTARFRAFAHAPTFPAWTVWRRTGPPALQRFLPRTPTYARAARTLTHGAAPTTLARARFAVRAHTHAPRLVVPGVHLIKHGDKQTNACEPDALCVA